MNDEKILITGFPRSGTSVLTKFFMEMGFFIDTKWNFWDNKLNAGFENKKVSFINNLLIFSYKEIEECDYMDVVKDYISNIEDEVIKYPRFLFESKVLELWLELFPKSKIIMTYREPKMVLQSKNVHSMNFPFSEPELDEKWCECFVFLQTNKIPFCCFKFPNFLNMYGDIYTILKGIGIDFDKEYGRSVWDSIVDLNKVHFK